MRLKLVPDDTKIDFFSTSRISFAASLAAMALSVILFFVMGLNYGIDFRGGTTIRTESPNPVNVGAYRKALSKLDLGDVVISEVFDPTAALKDEKKHAAIIRIGVMKGQESVPAETIAAAEVALRTVDPDIRFTSVESVGPKVSKELIRTAVIAVLLSIAAVLFYIWLRFEWQFALGAVFALIHDVTLTIGVFALFQIRFDLSIVAALLTIVGYSLNDTVVVFDRVRENLQKYKKMPLMKLLNLSINETLSRTVMTSFTTLLALIALLVLGGDVIRDFVFAMTWGIVVGTYSSIFIASAILLRFGVKRDWSKPDKGAGGTRFGDAQV